MQTIDTRTVELTEQELDGNMWTLITKAQIAILETALCKEHVQLQWCRDIAYDKASDQWDKQYMFFYCDDELECIIET